MDEAVDHWKSVGDVIQLGLDGLERDSLIDQGLPCFNGDIYLTVDHSFAVPSTLTFLNENLCQNFAVEGSLIVKKLLFSL